MLIFPLINDTSRKIIHIDMDAFFAAIEERDNPQLRGKPIIIAKNPQETGGKGVVSTCNYEARKYGIRSAMSSKEAYERCPNAIFISGNYRKYQDIGRQVRDIFKRYTDLVEPLSIDEAYLDVTENKIGVRSAIKIAKLIQKDIWLELQLTCSAGVSYNKFLAKLASDYQKPAGLTVILPEESLEFLKRLPIEKFYGVGQKTVQRLHEMGVYHGSDLLEIPEMILIDTFGRLGYELYRKARGVSNSPVKPNRLRKSIGSEKTYNKLLYEEGHVKVELSKHAKRVTDYLIKHRRLGKVVVIKVRYSDFSTLTRRLTLPIATKDLDIIERAAYELFDSLEESSLGIRLLGVTVTHLESDTPLLLDL